jgi:propionate CoA-transferase
MASSADTEGNIYMDGATTLTENLEAARAARRNGGVVLVGVGRIRPRDESAIFLPAQEVDGIVVDPLAEQTACFFTKDPWKALTVENELPIRDATEQVAFINGVLGITPRRREADRALARMASDLFSRVVRPGSVVNVGVGLPEEVCREVAVGGLARDVTFVVETGAIGGFPAAGVFFGAAIAPQRLLTSAQGFRFCHERLEVSVLGFLQVDAEGNVNVSRRGEGPRGAVGPGGFPDIAAAARTLIFVGTWMAGAEFSVVGGKLRTRRKGTPKFVAQVEEITLNGKEALAQGKQVWFVTNVGVLHLTERGLELEAVAPGIDPEDDIVRACPARVLLPADGVVPVLDSSLLTGLDFHLAWRSEDAGAASAPAPRHASAQA